MAGRPPTTGLFHTGLLLLFCASHVVWHADAMRWTKRRVGYIDGDLIIGALFPVHKEPTVKSAYTRECGAIWEQYGMHRIEIFFQTLDKINNDSDILPGIVLGCDIRDSCWYAPVALEQSIDFIKNSIASMEQTNRTVARNECRSDDFDITTDKPIAALIGPGSSSVTMQVQNLLSLFNIPEIGYSATSRDFSNKNLYNYFSRVVPSDELQVRALVDIIARYNWTYISAVYTDGNYGSSGFERFKFHAEKKGLCIATESRVGNTAEAEAYDEVVHKLLNNKRARVVLCFCEGTTVHNLFNATKRLGVANEFMVIGSDGWNVRPDVVDELHKEASGGISIKLYSPAIPEFDNYYLGLKPDLHPTKEVRNPWFTEFWQQKFECYLPTLPKNERGHFNKSCTGQESLHDKQYIPDAKLGFVVNAVYTVAYALHNMHQTLCKGVPGLCPAMIPLNGTILRNFLFNVSFLSYSNDKVVFDVNGDPPGRYDIMNYQPNVSEDGNVTYSYVLVGQWASGNLTMFDDRIYWPGLGRNPAKKIESVCSHPCPKGSIKQIQDSSKSCCWICQQCKDNEYVLDDHSCKPCQKGWLPDKDLKACYEIKIEHIKWNDTEAVIAIAMAIVGMATTGSIIFIFIRHNNTPVVKASTRELSHIILIGIFMAYAATFSLVAKPTLITCYLNRIMPGISFALIYGALVTKTNRIARILAGSKKKIMTRKPRFMSASAQVVITCILIGIECSIITVMLILEPADNKLEYPSKDRVKLTCNATKVGIIVPLGFDIFLIAMCTFYAIKTRNLPENFNEAKFIGFSMYTTCVIWTAFVPIYFGSDNKVVTMCLAVSLSATVALVLLFFPKVYIILCKPEKNNRSVFITSKDVRCHIGSQSGGRSYNNSSDSVDRLGLLDSEPVDAQNSTSNGDLDVDSDRSVIKPYGQKKKPNKKLNVFPWKTSKSDQKQVHIRAELGADDQIWNDKSFEQAALKIYRQKSFFNRWKNKSLMRNATSPESFSQPFQNRTLPTANRNCRTCHMHDSDSQYHISAHQENIPLRDARRMNSFLHRARNVSIGDSETNLTNDEDVPRRFGNRYHSNTSITMHDFAVQTDDELLKQLLPSIRRRVLNSDSSGSTRSQDSNSRSTRTQGSNGKGRQRKTSRSSSASKNSYHSSTGMADYAFPVSSARSTPKHHEHQHPVQCDSVERMLLVEDLKLDQHNMGYSPNMLGVSDKSPLLASAEHSPLLSTDERFAFDSTSEETLSEQEPGEQLDDIEELLSGAGSQADSFESSHLDILNPDGGFPEFPDYGPIANSRRSQFQDGENTAMTSVETATTDLDPVVSYLDDDEDYEWSRTMDRYRRNGRPHEHSYHPHIHHVCNDPTHFTLPYNNDSEHYYVNRMDPCLNNTRVVQNHIRSHSPRRHPLSIPQIYVDCVSPSLSEADPVSPPPAVRHEDRRHSGESSSSDRTRSSISLEDVVGMRLLDDEADSVAKFQDYLKTRGLKLDMNSVQSSDV